MCDVFGLECLFTFRDGKVGEIGLLEGEDEDEGEMHEGF